jgi:hypothetical protein
MWPENYFHIECKNLTYSSNFMFAKSEVERAGGGGWDRFERAEGAWVPLVSVSETWGFSAPSLQRS